MNNNPIEKARRKIANYNKHHPNQGCCCQPAQQQTPETTPNTTPETSTEQPTT